ncbi:MAG: transcription-repair coupling factor [Bacteroidota bacterium]
MNSLIEKDTLLVSKFSSYRFINKINEIINSSQKFEISIKKLISSAKSIFLAALCSKCRAKYVVLCDNNTEAESWYDDIILLIDEKYVSIIKEPKQKTIEKELNINLSYIVEGLNKFIESNSGIIILNKAILSQQLPKINEINEKRITLNKGSKIDYVTFTQNLLLNGFQKETFVSQHGEVSIRGNIIDIFPIGFENPIRIEIWDDEIENIREFEPISQRSIKNLSEVTFINNTFDASNNFYGNIFEYFDKNTIIVFDYIETDEQLINKFSSYNSIVLNPLGNADINININPQPNYYSQIAKFKEELINLANQKYDIIIAANGEIHLKRLKELLELSINDDIVFDNLQKNIIWQNYSLSSGFIIEEEQFAYFTEHQIFNRQRVAPSKRSKKHQGITLKELRQLQIGDYIVHEDKGIGKFDGFQTIEIGGNKQDAIRIIFADGDLLYVHLNYIHKIQKYTSSEGVVPKLTKLGSSEWTRKKSRIKSRLKDIARDLIKLYAERKSSEGFAFPADDIWQQEFEASFYFEDTPDQASATAAVKKDMENSYPMDRLICGDVGFGKTEIAIRAAFKAANSGKQVAVLVPTTILAEQHFQTFSDRISRYPIKIDVLSRFKSKSEQKKIIENLAKGKIDIIIGTHRLLSKDVKFNNLGLLIIDEEHRFGVAAKEKLRQLKVNIDTLTMTATPIPRTLNFSLLGARDLSIIETPPRNRLPIETEIIEFNLEFLSKIIIDEVNRSGQVFFVNDKIEGIDKLAADLSMLLPNMKYGIVHGQMPTNEVETVMKKFLERKFSVLFATKIIEAGIDIPNANTMIINNAHNFGLAELYQLRGRVGRSNTQAYCFLVVPNFKILKKQSIQRLQAIEEFTELGSGLRLAMRDLEIRGAGNLLGAEQSGFIVDIGYELYQKILDEAVYELRTQEYPELFQDIQHFPKSLDKEITIEIDRDAFFPEYYIENSTDRFNYYKLLYNCKTNKELDELTKEIVDKYGKLPEEAKSLFFAVRLRIASLNTGFNKITLKNKKLIAEFPDTSDEYYYNNIFLHLVEFVNTMNNINLKQIKTKLHLETHLKSDADAIELMWKIKKSIELFLQ